MLTTQWPPTHAKMVEGSDKQCWLEKMTFCQHTVSWSPKMHIELTHKITLNRPHTIHNFQNSCIVLNNPWPRLCHWLITVLSRAQSCHPHIKPINNTAGFMSNLQMTKTDISEMLVATHKIEWYWSSQAFSTGRPVRKAMTSGCWHGTLTITSMLLTQSVEYDNCVTDTVPLTL